MQVCPPPPRSFMGCRAFALRRKFSSAALLLPLWWSVATAADLTPDDVIELVQAGRARFHSIKATIHREARTDLTGQSPEPWPLFGISHTLFRWTPSRSYAREDQTAWGPNDRQEEATPSPTRECASAPQWSKRLDTPHSPEPDHARPRATISRPDPNFAKETDMDVCEALWEQFDQIVASGEREGPISVRMDKDRAWWWLERIVRERDYRQAVAIDASRGWLPVRSEVTDITGERGMKIECGDLREVGDHLWLPFQFDSKSEYRVGDVVRRQWSSYRLSDVRVNVPIADDQLDIAFPDGTRVDDRIANLRYIVDRRAPRRHRQLSRMVRPGDIGFGAPLTEADLRRAEQMALAGLDADALAKVRSSGRERVTTLRVWLLAIAGLLVVAASGLAVRHRRRGVNQAATVRGGA